MYSHNYRFFLDNLLEIASTLDNASKNDLHDGKFAIQQTTYLKNSTTDLAISAYNNPWWKPSPRNSFIYDALFFHYFCLFYRCYALS